MRYQYPKWPLIIGTLLCSLILAAADPPQFDPQSGEQIKWQIISAGGTQSSSTNYKLGGTVGQIAVGLGTSTSYNLNSGYWQAFASPCQGKCGDANQDGAVNVSDAVWIINYVFAGGLPPKPVAACGDANGDGASNVSDAVYIINYVFAGGSQPGDCKPASWPDDCCPF